MIDLIWNMLAVVGAIYVTVASVGTVIDIYDQRQLKKLSEMRKAHASGNRSLPQPIPK